MNNGSSVIIETKKSTGDQHRSKRHTIDTTRPCVHSSTTTPLFHNDDNDNNKRRRRHSTAIIGSHSSALLRNCSGTAFLRQHRKAFSLDTTPLLPSSFSSYYYDSNTLNDHQQSSNSDDDNNNNNNNNDPTIGITNNNNNTTNTTPITTTTTTTSITAVESSAIITNNTTTECNNHNAMATRSSMPPTSSSEQQPTDSVDHQVIDISNRVPDKAIRIERDYSQGNGITRFSNEYPLLLAGRITPEQFQHTIDGINHLLEEAERVSWRVVFDNVMECLTIYTWPIFFRTHYQQCIQRLLTFIHNENETLYHQHGISISNPIRCAYLFLEFKMYN